MFSDVLLPLIVFPLILFVIGQILLIYYGDRFRNWTAQRSTEKMIGRVKQLKNDIEEAREISRTMTPRGHVSSMLLSLLCSVLPATITIIFLALLILVGNLIGEASTNLNSVSKYLYFASYILMMISLLWISFLLWRVFYNETFRYLTKLLRNSISFDKFETETTQAIEHLEGRIKRMEK